MEYGMTDANIQSNYGLTALHIAAFRNHVDVARLRMEYGEKDLTKDINGCMALHIAAFENHVELARLLMEQSEADPNVQNKIGSTPLNSVEVVRLLLEHGKTDANIQNKHGIYGATSCCLQKPYRSSASPDGTSQDRSKPSKCDWRYRATSCCLQKQCLNCACPD